MIAGALLDPEAAGFCRVVVLSGHQRLADWATDPAIGMKLVAAGLLSADQARVLERWMPRWILNGGEFIESPPHAEWAKGRGARVAAADMAHRAWWNRLGVIQDEEWGPVLMAVGPGGQSLAWNQNWRENPPRCLLLLWDESQATHLNWLKGLDGLVPTWEEAGEGEAGEPAMSFPLLGQAPESGGCDVAAYWSMDGKDWHEGARVWQCGMLPSRVGDVMPCLPTWVTKHAPQASELPVLWGMRGPADPALAGLGELLIANLVAECRDLETRGLGLSRLQEFLERSCSRGRGFRVAGRVDEVVTVCANGRGGDWVAVVARARWIRGHGRTCLDMMHFFRDPMHWIAQPRGWMREPPIPQGP